MKTVYIAGPMTGYKDLNYPAFFAAEEMLSTAGYTVENPARNPDPAPKTWEEYMRLSIPQLCRCRNIALLPGATESKGARIELALANILNMRVLHLKEVDGQYSIITDYRGE